MSGFACPFCGAPWTAAMRAQLERHSSGTYCACCAPGRGAAQHVGPLALPAQDLCCEACSKPIYRVPAVAGNSPQP